MGESRQIPLEDHLRLLEAIERNPRVTQASLAVQLGVAVGTVNWYVNRLISRGYVKIRRMKRKRLLYLITPRGITEKSRLGVKYMRSSLRVYRKIRAQVQSYLRQVSQAGYTEIIIDGNSDAGEICKLTCLEYGIQVAQPLRDSLLPVLKVDGMQVKLIVPK